jgi:hypothetical protein
VLYRTLQIADTTENLSNINIVSSPDCPTAGSFIEYFKLDASLEGRAGGTIISKRSAATGLSHPCRRDRWISANEWWSGRPVPYHLVRGRQYRAQCRPRHRNAHRQVLRQILPCVVVVKACQELNARDIPHEDTPDEDVPEQVDHLQGEKGSKNLVFHPVWEPHAFRRVPLLRVLTAPNG